MRLNAAFFFLHATSAWELRIPHQEHSTVHSFGQCGGVSGGQFLQMGGLICCGVCWGCLMGLWSWAFSLLSLPVRFV